MPSPSNYQRNRFQKRLVADEDVTGTIREVLAIHGFSRVVWAWSFGNFADAALLLTAAIWAKTLTGSDAAAGLMLAMLGLPALLAPVIGQMADRFSRRNLMVATYLLAALIVPALFLVKSERSIWIAYVVVFLYACASYCAAAAQGGLVRDMLSGRLLAPANSLLSSIDHGLRIIGPPMGAVMFSAWGIGPIIVATSVAFIIAAGILWRRGESWKPHGCSPSGGFWRGSLSGFSFIYHHPKIRAAMLAVVLAVGATGTLNVTNFSTIEQGLGRGPEFLAVLASLQGAFSILGALTSVLVVRRIGTRGAMIASVVLLAIALPALATNSVLLVVAAMVVLGFGVPWGLVAFITLRQMETPSQLQGRSGAATNLMLNVPQLGSAALAAAIIGTVDYRSIIVVCSLVCVAALVPLLSRRS